MDRTRLGLVYVNLFVEISPFEGKLQNLEIIPVENSFKILIELVYVNNVFA